jgi:hypothetical protein
MSKVHLLSLAVCLASSGAFAVEQGQYQFNGFGTVGITHMGGEDDYDYGIQGQTNDGWRGDQLSKLGVQMQYGITDTLSVTSQLATKAQQDSWGADLTALYLAWQANDNLTLRGGRLGTPVYMFSETLNVGFSYPWLRLPEEVYSLVQFSNHDGADLLYSRGTALGALSFQLSGGSTIGREYYALDDMYDVDYRDVFATSLALSTDSFGTFRIGYTEADVKLSLDARVTFPVIGTRDVNFVTLDGNKGKFSSIGHQYDNGTWLSAAEAVKLSVERNGLAETTAFYLMGGRRFDDFLAHLTYGQQDKPSGRQVSMTYGLNYSLSPSVTLKGEFKRVDTSQTSSSHGVFEPNAQQALNNALGQSFGTPDGDIFSVGVDFVF